jgi:hypothetical protein
LLEQTYEHVECRKKEGAHYTPQKLSSFVANKILEKVFLKQKVIIADPAIGDGELILSLLESIGSDLDVEVFGFDINSDSLRQSHQRITTLFPSVKLNLLKEDFLDHCLNIGTVFDNDLIPKFDYIIANPPYIRTQVLGAEKAQSIAKNFGLKGRVDIYQAFLIGMSKCLAENGIAGVIVSNRFLTTKGTGELRKILYHLYDISNIWDFGDTKLFDAAVLPAVLLLKNKKDNSFKETSFTSIYETQAEATASADDQIDALNFNGAVKCKNDKTYLVKHGILSFDSEPKDIWSIQDAASTKWLEAVNDKTWATFGDIGKIRVGVKTTADNVFINDSWQDNTGCTPELLKPLITHHVAARFRQSNKKTKSILYTHEVENGKKVAVDLSKFPISEQYLLQHREQLEGRKYVTKANRKWFEIWVPQNPDLWKKDKIVFRDIAEEPTFWLDDKGSIVNGDCYWMTNETVDHSKDILWLILAVANSKFIEAFYDAKFNNKLYSNKRRYISQYVEKFPLPDPTHVRSIRMANMAKAIFSESDDVESKRLQNILDDLVWEAFGLV